MARRTDHAGPREMSRPLEGQKALITGADSGIGAAIATAYAREGATVGINYRHGNEQAQALADVIRRDGGKVVLLEADVSHEAEVLAMFDRFTAACGRVDILVSNAGLQQDAPVEKMSLEQWNKVIDVNLTGAFLCGREAIRRFLGQDMSDLSPARGKILFMSSVHQLIPWGGHVNYAASKGGLVLLMQSLSQEVANRKIRINGIAPGAIKTPINESVWADPEKMKALLELIPYGRIGTPEDVARAAVWLACDASDYVNGTTLYVDGGMTLFPGFRENG